MRASVDAAEPVSYLTSMDDLEGVIGHRDVHSTSLRRRLGSMIRSSALGSVCSLTARNVSEAVQEPVFVSSRRMSGVGIDFRKLQRAPSLPSSTASTTVSGASSSVVADPRRWLLQPTRHRRGNSSGSIPEDAVSGVEVAVDLGVCRLGRYDNATATAAFGKTDRGQLAPRLPGIVMMPPSTPSFKQQPPPAPPNGNKGNAQPFAKPANVKKDKGKAKKAGDGVRLSSNPYGFTSSSSEEESGVVKTRGEALFSSDDDEEFRVTVRPRRRGDDTETLFSSDSTAGVDYYYQWPRSNGSSSGRGRRKRLVGGSGRGGGKEIVCASSSSRGGSTRFDLDDDGFRPLVSISSTNSTATGATTTTATTTSGMCTAACSSTTTTTSGTHSGTTSSGSPSSTSPISPNKAELLLSREEKKEKQPTATATATATALEQLHLAEKQGAPEQADDDGYAVVKESSDPYSDFRSSALEMIMERQLFGSKELERLLRAFLSLNHPSHHPVILHVFSEIWQALFDNS